MALQGLLKGDWWLSGAGQSWEEGDQLQIQLC